MHVLYDCMIKECLRHEVLRGTSHLPGLKLPQTLPRNLTWHAYAIMDFPMTERFVARWLVVSYGRWEFLQCLKHSPTNLCSTWILNILTSFASFYRRKEYKPWKIVIICLTDAFVSLIRTAAECRRLIGHSGPVFSTSFNNDNSFLLSSSADRTGVCYFYFQSCKCSFELWHRAHLLQEGLVFIIFGSNISFFLLVRLWSLYTFSSLVCYKGHNYPVWDVQFWWVV